VECARREAREEIGCQVEILHSPVTYLVDLALAQLDAPAPLLRTGVADVFRARPRGEPLPVDVPALVWVPVDVVPELGELMPSAELLRRGGVALGRLPDEVLIREDTAMGLLRAVVTYFGPTALD
jgi:8-oxo-dGTP pyrophosphatase MutT (NUDIX family)